MGMAAGQARLLSITARLSDNELRAQLINNDKMRLATQSSQVSEAYVTALNNAQLMFTNYDANNNQAYQQLTFNALTAYNPYNNQYALSNASGNVLLSETDAANYEFAKNTSNPLETFLACYGLEQSSSYFEYTLGAYTDNGTVYFPSQTTYTDASGNEYYANFNTKYTPAQLKAMYYGGEYIDENNITYNYTGYENILQSEEYWNFASTMQNYTDAYETFAPMVYNNIKEWITSTTYNTADTGNASIYKSGLGLTMLSANNFINLEGIALDILGITLKLNNLSGSGLLSDHGENKISEYISRLNAVIPGADASGETATNLALNTDQKLTTDNEDQIVYEAKPATGSVRTINVKHVNVKEYEPEYTKEDGTIVNAENGSITLETDYSISFDASLTGTQLQTDPQISHSGYYITMNEVTLQGIKDTNNDIVFRYYNTTDSAGKDTIATTWLAYPNETVKEYTEIRISEDQLTELFQAGFATNANLSTLKYYDAQNTDGNNWNTGTEKTINNVIDYNTQIIKTTSYSLDTIVTTINGIIEEMLFNAGTIFEISNDLFATASSQAAKENLDKYFNELYKIIYGEDPTNKGSGLFYTTDLVEKLFCNSGDYTKDASDGMIDGYTWNVPSGFEDIYQVLLLDRIMDFYGEPDYAWVDVNNGQENGEAKAKWYENLFNRIEDGGYKTLKNGLASSTEWIQFAFESGIVTLEQVDDKYTWNKMIYSNCSDITEQTNDAAIAKAEAEYKAAMNKIENKDKRYDMELKNIDTEHNSLQTEYDSIKSAIDKNIERSFKLYS